MEHCQSFKGRSHKILTWLADCQALDTGFLKPEPRKSTRRTQCGSCHLDTGNLGPMSYINRFCILILSGMCWCLQSCPLAPAHAPSCPFSLQCQLDSVSFRGHLLLFCIRRDSQSRKALPERKCPRSHLHISPTFGPLPHST